MLKINARSGQVGFDTARVIPFDAMGNTLVVRKPWPEPGTDRKPTRFFSQRKRSARDTPRPLEFCGGKRGDVLHRRNETFDDAIETEMHQEILQAARSSISIIDDIERAITSRTNYRTMISLFPVGLVEKEFKNVFLYFFYTESLSALPLLTEGQAEGKEEINILPIPTCLGLEAQSWNSVLKRILSEPLGSITDVQKMWPHMIIKPSHAYYLMIVCKTIAGYGFNFDQIQILETH